MKEIIRHRISESLVKQFTDGDIRAFDSIYSTFNPRLQKFVFSLVKTEIDAEEIVQEVFVKTWENRDKLKTYSSFDSYLFTIAYNTTVNMLRKRIKEARYIEYVKSVQVEFDETEHDASLNKDDVSERLSLLIEKMPVRQREVFKMKHFQDYSYKEIAESLQISINTVENHMVKAHRYLKENLGKNYFLVLLYIHLFS